MDQLFDVIVIGLGANGSSALFQLSKTGKKIAGFDQFVPPHAHGSSHGQTRIIRQAYHESPFYVPFLKKAYQLWDEIEKTSGKKMFLNTGGLMLGHKDSAVIQGSRLSAETYNIPYRYLRSDELLKSFPVFKVNPETVGILEHDAGILFPEECIRIFLEEAAKNGAKLKLKERILSVKAQTDYVKLTTETGNYCAEKVVISTGAWMSDLTADLNLPLKVERQVLFWFKNRSASKKRYLKPGNMPVYIWEYEDHKMFYGFPDLGEGIKIAYHHSGRNIAPDELKNDVTDLEIRDMKDIAEKYIDMDAKFNYAAVCMYTNTPDENFIIDFHPGHRNVIIASPCSGHGFKFCSLTGKLISEMAVNNQPSMEISAFSLNRFF